MRGTFAEHFGLDEEQTRTAWKEFTFVFDTNILLNFYRVSRDVSDSMLKILRGLRGRLFLPHQVAAEFFKNRETVIAEQVNSFEQLRELLRKFRGDLGKKLERHPTIPIEEFISEVDGYVLKLINRIDENQKSNQQDFIFHPDPILPQIASIFESCCGKEPSEESERNLQAMVDARFKENKPPCNRGQNAQSQHNEHAGDGRVWLQTLEYVNDKKCGLIFVTGDKQSNWWRSVKIGNSPKVAGPQIELLKDIQRAAGKPLLMYDQAEFLRESSNYLQSGDQAKAINEIEKLIEMAQMSVSRLESRILSKPDSLESQNLFRVTLKAVMCGDNESPTNYRWELAETHSTVFPNDVAEFIREVTRRYGFPRQDSVHDLYFEDPRDIRCDAAVTMRRYLRAYGPYDD